MAATWILSKNSGVEGSAETFVPEGVIVHVFANVDEAALGENGLTALASNTVTETRAVTGPGVIGNYVLGAIDAETVTKLTTTAGFSGTVISVGADLTDRTKLCSDPSVCVAPRHADTCSGLFTQLDEAEIYLADIGGEAETTAAGGLMNPWQQHAADLLGWARSDPAGMLSQFHGYDREMQSLLVQSSTDLNEWLTSIHDPAAEAAKEASSVHRWIDNDYRLWLIGNPLPGNITDVWANEHWRHVFQTWYTEKAQATGAYAALLTLYTALNTYYDQENAENLQAVSAICNGEHGDTPACDSGDIETLRQAIAERDEHGEHSETPDRDAAIISEAVHRLYTGVTGQFDQNFSTFAQDIEELKAETY